MSCRQQQYQKPAAATKTSFLWFFSSHTFNGPRAGTKLYIQLFRIDRKLDRRRVCFCCCWLDFRESFFVTFICSLAFTTAGLDAADDDDIRRKIEITFQFLFTIDEASQHLEFYWDFPTASLPNFMLCHAIHSGIASLCRATNADQNRNKTIRFMNFYYELSPCPTAHLHDCGTIMKIGINCFASAGIQRF